MNEFMKLARGWAERLTLSVLDMFNVEKETLVKVKDAFNEKEKNLNETLEDLKSKDPARLDSYLNLEKILAWLKPLVIAAFILAGLYLVSKIYHEIKKR